MRRGAIWEAALFAPFHKLENLVVMVDYNKIQSFGTVKEVLDLEPLADKWRAFGWHVVESTGTTSLPCIAPFRIFRPWSESRP